MTSRIRRSRHDALHNRTVLHSLVTSLLGHLRSLLKHPSVPAAADKTSADTAASATSRRTVSATATASAMTKRERELPTSNQVPRGVTRRKKCNPSRSEMSATVARNVVDREDFEEEEEDAWTNRDTSSIGMST